MGDQAEGGMAEDLRGTDAGDELDSSSDDPDVEEGTSKTQRAKPRRRPIRAILRRLNHHLDPSFFRSPAPSVSFPAFFLLQLGAGMSVKDT